MLLRVMRWMLALLIASLALAATPDPFANHDRAAWTKALDGAIEASAMLQAQAVKARGEVVSVARMWAHASELREMVQRCAGNADAETLRRADICLKSADDYIDRRWREPVTPPTSPRSPALPRR